MHSVLETKYRNSEVVKTTVSSTVDLVTVIDIIPLSVGTVWRVTEKFEQEPLLYVIKTSVKQPVSFSVLVRIDVSNMKNINLVRVYSINLYKPSTETPDVIFEDLREN